MTKLCGIRPTGGLHIGHYFAVIKPGMEGANVLIAQYHAPESEDVTEVYNTLKSFGIQNIVLQSAIFDPLFYFRMLELTHLGELQRMTQFRGSSSPSAHLLCYPVLMACDVAGYDEIVVGEDQGQHLNFARDLLERYNKAYNKNITIPAAKPEAGRIRSLTDPAKKMSKSEPNGCLFLTDSPELIRKKIKKAVTDEIGRENLLDRQEKYRLQYVQRCVGNLL